VNDENADRQQYLDELRRDAYARPTTPAEHECAAEAQRLLAAEESRERAAPESAGDDPATPLDPAEQLDTDEPGEADEAGPPAPPKRRRSLVIAAAVALVVGLGTGFGGGVVGTEARHAAEARDRAAAESPEAGQLLSDQLIANMKASGVPYVGAGTAQQISGTGDSGAALRWLEREQTLADLPAETVPGADPDSLHLVYESATWGRIWIARGLNETLCFYWSDGPGVGSLGCTDVEGFDVGGLSTTVVATDTSGVLTLRWDGHDVLAITSPSR